MNYERGLEVLDAFVPTTDSERWNEFQLAKAQLLSNLQREQRFGSTETTRSERAQIVFKLNPLALHFCGLSFTDLCMGKTPPSAPVAPPAAMPIQPKSGETGPAAAPAPVLYGTGERWAILVGVNQYDDQFAYGPLDVCGNDVQALHAQLIAKGFRADRIRLLTDISNEKPTRENILLSLKLMAQGTGPDDLLLFYYSGHGDTDNLESYLVARNGHRLALSDTAVSFRRIRELMETAAARAKFIILDACHSGVGGKHKGAQSMSPAFLRHIFDESSGLAVLASCRQHELSYPWPEEQRSVFTHFLLAGLSGAADRDAKGFVTAHDLSRYLTVHVKEWALQRKLSQTPTFEYRGVGDIVLAHYTP